MARKKAVVNPTSRTRAIELEGKQYTAEFNFHGYAVMKELTGISLLMGWDESTMDAREYACLLYAALVTHQPDIDIEFCFDSLRGENFMEVIAIVWEAYRASMPAKKDDLNPTKPIGK